MAAASRIFAAYMIHGLSILALGSQALICNLEACKLPELSALWQSYDTVLEMPCHAVQDSSTANKEAPPTDQPVRLCRSLDLLAFNPVALHIIANLLMIPDWQQSIAVIKIEFGQIVQDSISDAIPPPAPTIVLKQSFLI